MNILKIRFLLFVALLFSFVFVSNSQALEVREKHKCTYMLKPDVTGTKLEKHSFGKNWICGYMVVPKNPIDKLGTVNPQTDSIWIRYAYYHKKGPKRTTLVTYAGGPGQGAFAFSLDFKKDLKPFLKQKDMLVFDQRGTGIDGGVLDTKCSKSKTEKDCRETIGKDYLSYSTKHTVEDTELIRKQLRIEKLDLYGVSYGTKAAWDYARYYPQNVEKIILDSPVGPEDDDPYSLYTLGAVQRILNQICSGKACEFTNSAAGDLKILLSKMDQKGRLQALVPFKNGKKTLYSFSQTDFLSIMLDTDFSTYERLQLPGLIRAAAYGDETPLLRLLGNKVNRKKQTARLFRANASKNKSQLEQIVAPDISEVSYALTLCSDQSMPWTTKFGTKQSLDTLKGIINNLPKDKLFGWNRQVVKDLNFFQTCAQYGGFDNTPVPSKPAPKNIPALVLSGLDDMRTPNEIAQQYKNYGAQILSVPHLGHSVLSANAKCVQNALDNFDKNIVVNQCETPKPVKAASPIYKDYKKIKGNQKQKANQAFVETFYDFLDNYAFSTSKVQAGLRGGYYRVSKNEKTIVFHNFKYYNNFAVSGKLSATKTSLDGTLQVGNQKIRITSKKNDLLFKGRAKGQIINVSLNNYDQKALNAYDRIINNYLPK